jgi:hypothetical protein
MIGNNCISNGSDGINGGRITAVHNTLSFNAGEGIDLASAGLAQANTAANNTGVGIQCTGVAGGCNVIDNVVTNNNVRGLSFGIAGAYKGNVINANNATVTGGTQTGQNFCDGNTTCP